MSEKLFVVPHGIDQRFLDIAPAELTPDLVALGVREPYLVYCGEEVARKRLDWTIEIFQAIENSEPQLVICSLGRGTPSGFRGETAAGDARTGPPVALYSDRIDGSVVPKCSGDSLSDAL